MTIGSSAASTAVIQIRKLFWPSAGGAALALVFLFGVPARRRKKQAALWMLLLLVALAGVVSCGGGGSSAGGGGTTNPGTTPGTYTVTVTGTSGSISAAGKVTLTVQ